MPWNPILKLILSNFVLVGPMNSERDPQKTQPQNISIVSKLSLRVRLVGVEKWKDGKYLVFPRVSLVGGMEKWEGGKLFCLVEKKSRRIKNVVYIN